MPRNRVLRYNPRLKTRAQELRKNGTLAEVVLWREIKGKKLGCEFHCQVPIDEFIVDFFCHELKLAIEVDGCSHGHPDIHAWDQRRQARMEALGVRFMRFQDSDIMRNLERVLRTIRARVNAIDETSP